MKTTSYHLHAKLLNLANSTGQKPPIKGGAYAASTENEALWIIANNGFITAKTASKIWPNETQLQVTCRLLNISAPKCAVCNEQIKFISLKAGWKVYPNDTCSAKCVEMHPIRKAERSVRGVHARSFVKNVDAAWSNNSREKRTKTNLQKYGHKTAWNTEVNNKRKETLLGKYGTNNSFRTPTGIEKTAKQKEQEKNGSKNRLESLNSQFSCELWDGHNYESLWKCKRCFTSSIKINTNPTCAIRCPNCDPPVGSLIQHRFKELIENTGIEVKYNTRKIIAPLEIDIWLPEYNVGIEVNGLYWHSYNEHETSKQKNAALEKWKLCRNKNIRLFTFFEDELLTKQDICASIVLNACGKSKVLYARNLQYGTISIAESRSFMLQNHLHGYAPCSEAFALYLGDDPIMVATFSPSRFQKGKTELIRLATAKGYRVQGGVSKIIKNYNSPNLISYANKTMSMGDTYSKLGKLEKEIPPGYFWWHPKSEMIRLNRAHTRKSNLAKLLGESYNPEETEAQNMFSAGWRRIWDCGHLLFSLS